jgi:hypothetical protein
MSKITIEPKKQTNELLFLLSVTVGILLLAFILITLQGGEKAKPKLKHYQISAFSDLNSVDQSIFSDLFTAAIDIQNYHDQGTEVWPETFYLDKNFISPFTKDALWKSRGRITWRKLVLDVDNVHRVVYLGASSDTTAGSFVLQIEHFHGADGTLYYEVGREDQPYYIWYKKDQFTLPQNITAGTLISSGWKELVPYSGKDQLKKLER